MSTTTITAGPQGLPQTTLVDSAILDGPVMLTNASSAAVLLQLTLRRRAERSISGTTADGHVVAIGDSLERFSLGPGESFSFAGVANAQIPASNTDADWPTTTANVRADWPSRQPLPPLPVAPKRPREFISLGTVRTTIVVLADPNVTPGTVITLSM